MASTKKAGSLTLQEAEVQALQIWEVRALMALTKKAGRQTMLEAEVQVEGQMLEAKVQVEGHTGARCVICLLRKAR